MQGVVTWTWKTKRVLTNSCSQPPTMLTLLFSLTFISLYNWFITISPSFLASLMLFSLLSILFCLAMLPLFQCFLYSIVFGSLLCHFLSVFLYTLLFGCLLCHFLSAFLYSILFGSLVCHFISVFSIRYTLWFTTFMVSCCLGPLSLTGCPIIKFTFLIYQILSPLILLRYCSVLEI